MLLSVLEQWQKFISKKRETQFISTKAWKENISSRASTTQVQNRSCYWLLILWGFLTSVCGVNGLCRGRGLQRPASESFWLRGLGWSTHLLADRLSSLCLMVKKQDQDVMLRVRMDSVWVRTSNIIYWCFVYQFRTSHWKKEVINSRRFHFLVCSNFNLLIIR